MGASFGSGDSGRWVWCWVACEPFGYETRLFEIREVYGSLVPVQTHVDPADALYASDDDILQVVVVGDVEKAS